MEEVKVHMVTHTTSCPNSLHYMLLKLELKTLRNGANGHLCGDLMNVKEKGKGTISNTTCTSWLKKHRPRHGIFPHKLDYCDTCARLTNDINAKNATKNRLLQNSQSTPEDIQNIEEDIHLLEKNLQDHKTDAHKAYEYYKECIKRCQDQWENLVLLEESGDSEELECKKHTFTAVLSADYQMSKLIPHWGYSPQPGSTYYLQKLSNDIFGIVDHRRQQSMIYVTPEMYGPKNTEHTVSYLLHYLKNSGLVPDWVQWLHIFTYQTTWHSRTA